MAQEWQRLVATTIADYGRGVEDFLMAKRLLFKMLQSKGQMVYNSAGLTKNWQTEYRIAQLIPNNGEQTISPARQNRFQQPNIDFIGYQMSDAVTKREKMKNRGPEALVDIFDGMAKWLMSNAVQRLGEELYVDSTAAGNSQKLSGIETMMGLNGTVNITSGAQRTANAADVVGYPSSTYAGLSTVLGNYSGTWNTQTNISTTWPAGKGELGYDFWSPISVNSSSTAWNAASTGFGDTCVQCTRFAAIQNQRYVSDAGSMRTLLYDRDNYRLYLNKLDPVQRVEVMADSGLKAFGFKDTFRQDGVDIAWEFGMPAGNGYGFNIEEMYLHSMQDKMFVPEGPIWHPLNRYYYVIVDFLGQMQFTAPRFFCKVSALA